MSVLLNNGDGTFAPYVAYVTGKAPLSVFSADLDGDTDNDLVVANHSSGVSVLLNNGDGTFAPKVEYDALIGPINVFSTDFDGDGDHDIAARHWGSAIISVWLNHGDGTLAPRADYEGPRFSGGIFSADLDGDGDNDLAAPGEDDDSVSVLLNHGDGTFGSKVEYAVGRAPRAVVGADFDGDGDIDLAATNAHGTTVSVLLNTTDRASPITAVLEERSSAVPKFFALHQNYPNPFNPKTTITYDVARSGTVRLSLYASNGQHIRTLVDEERPAGSYSVIWDGADGAGQSVASGVYLCRMKVGEYSAVRKMVLVR